MESHADITLEALRSSIHFGQRKDWLATVGSPLYKHIPHSAKKRSSNEQSFSYTLAATIVFSHYISIPVYLQDLFTQYLTTQCRHLVSYSFKREYNNCCEMKIKAWRIYLAMFSRYYPKTRARFKVLFLYRNNFKVPYSIHGGRVWGTVLIQWHISIVLPLYKDVFLK